MYIPDPPRSAFLFEEEYISIHDPACLRFDINDAVKRLKRIVKQNL